MAKRNTKERLIQTAWALFEEKGFDNVSIDEIVEVADSSKGSFYHYFASKDELLQERPKLIDFDYEQWLRELDPELHAAEKLIRIGRKICKTMELNLPRGQIALVYSSQLVAKRNRYMADDSRNRWSLFNKVILEGQERGQISDRIACTELSQMIDIMLRGLIYNWCLLDGAYSLEALGGKMLSVYLDSLRIG